MLKAAIYVLITVGALLGGWYGWRWWGKGKEPVSIQTIPTTPLDQ